MTQPAHMWSYWRDKKGIVSALEDYYDDRLAANPVLQMALNQIKLAEASIEYTMQTLADKETDEEE